MIAAISLVTASAEPAEARSHPWPAAAGPRVVTSAALQSPFGVPAEAPAAKPAPVKPAPVKTAPAKTAPAKTAPAKRAATKVAALKGDPAQSANAHGVAPVAAPTPVVPTVAAAPAAPAPAAPAPAAPAPAAPAPAAPASGCAAALAYLNANAAPGFIHECPGYAYGNSAMTCVNHAPECPGQKIIAIAIPCPAAYMNEASNSWVLTGVRSGPLDPYGTC